MYFGIERLPLPCAPRLCSVPENEAKMESLERPTTPSQDTTRKCIKVLGPDWPASSESRRERLVSRALEPPVLCFALVLDLVV